ncbi:uncharacterized protein [Amphiura filiformis]|uniref:uncharacterized protein isoform X2 n=1 Tax=Amphiura filiformis TaxID=82378 RepID=UPI003B2259B8
MKVVGLSLIFSALLPVLLLVEAKPSPKAYDVPDIDEDIMPPAPRGEPFQETERDAMMYILEDNEPIEKEIVDGEIPQVLVDGDIYEPVRNESSRSKRNAVKGRRFLWPGGLVPYVISPYFHSDSKLAVLAAMQRFHDRTCIRFRPRTIEEDFIYVGPGQGCWSLVGRQGKRQSVSLGATCKTKRGTIMHELMHVLGFRHEHNRPDRDHHVVIYWENIAKSMDMNFKKYPYNSVDLLGVQYDFGSIMHYPMYAFSRNGAATLSPRYTIYQEIGFRNDFSNLDVYRINTLYKCGACQDTDHDHCPTWAMGGSCDRNRNWMSKNCAFSCRMCKTNSYGACSDNHGSCGPWAKVGECIRNPPWMKETCPLSCGGCPMDIRNRQDEIVGCHDKNTLCYDWALIGECHANKGFMSKMCRLSCSFCDDQEIQQMGRENEACKNRHPTCSEWAKHDLCDTYSSWMYPNCPESCNQCPSTRDKSNDHLRPTLSSEDTGNHLNHTAIATANGTHTNLTIPDGVEVQPLSLQANLETLEVEVVQATEPPIKILQLQNNNSSDGECHDRDGRCVIWADEGRCRKANRFMFDYCRYSCRLCDVDEFQLKDVCRDIHGFCSIFAKEGDCEDNEEWMRIYCKKSCGFCQRSALPKEKVPADKACGDRSTSCSLMVARGDCNKARKRMKFACPRSCRFCGVSEKDCRDRNARCPTWAKSGDCSRYGRWMRVNCPWSCDSCSNNITYNRDCLDTYRKCPTWAEAGECESNDWMKLNCRFSCDSCDFTVANPNCTDKFKRCKFQSESGACTRDTSVKWMTKNCHRSCNLCEESSNEVEFADWNVHIEEVEFDEWNSFPESDSFDWSSVFPAESDDESTITGECRDLNPFCPKWAEANQCIYNPSMMRRECKASCNLCPKVPECYDKYDTKECKRWAWMGECLTNPEGTRSICKKSCGQCGEREGCRDLNRRCIKWAKQGECTKKSSIKFMKKHCGPSCGLCTPEIIENKYVKGSEQGVTKAKKKVKVKKPLVTTPSPSTTKTATTAPEPTTPAPVRKSAKGKMKHKRNKKKVKTGGAATRQLRARTKKKQKSKTGSTETRQLRPGNIGGSASRPNSRELSPRKMKRLRKRLEKAMAQSKAIAEKRALKLAAQTNHTETDTAETPEQTIHVGTQLNPVQELVNPVQGQTNQEDEELTGTVDDQTHGDAQNGDQTTDTL